MAMAEFVMPRLGADMTAGKLIAWRKKVGDAVTSGEIIADVETDKADIEVEVFTSGVIEKILVQPGEKVPVGSVLAIIRREGEAVSALPAAEAPDRDVVSTAPAPPSAPHPATSAQPGRVRVSPAAKKLAAELGIDLAPLTGTGPASRITREDVERAARLAAERPEPREQVTTVDRPARMRQTIGAAMARSKREIPHYYLSTTIDMNSSLSWLAEQNSKRSVEDRLLYGVLLVKAVSLVLRQCTELNGFWIDGRSVPSPDIHVGVAISLRGGGLVAPALRNTDRQSLDELMQNFRDLVNRARALSLRSSELSDPTVTITSLGEQGVEAVFPIIYPPQVAMVGFGTIVTRPWSVGGQVVSRPLITATLAADHRVSDGHRGALFLAAVDRLLQEPAKL